MRSVHAAGVITAALFSLLSLSAQAQSNSAAPQAKDKALPRLANGHPDFNGTWDNGSGIDFVRPQKHEDGSVCISGCGPARTGAAGAAAPRPAPDRPKYKPEYLAKVKELHDRQVEMDPVLRCRAPGVPRIGPPDKIVQLPHEIVFLYDDVSGGFFRIIPVNGRKHRTDVDESYLGDAVGRFEGDTLVIESRSFNEDTWLTDDGAFHTKDLRVVETLRRTSMDTMEWQATAYDTVLAEPWQLRPRLMKLSDTELFEPVPCVEQDLKHIVDGSHHDNPR